MTGKKKILIVEDEDDIITYLKAIFEDNGYDTLIASDGIEGINIAKSIKPDLITLDLAMPNQSGVRTYRQCREDGDLKDIPVVVITAVGDDMERYFQKTPGFQRPDGFMNKPIEKERLVDLVDDIIFGSE